MDRGLTKKAWYERPKDEETSHVKIAPFEEKIVTGLRGNQAVGVPFKTVEPHMRKGVLHRS